MTKIETRYLWSWVLPYGTQITPDLVKEGILYLESEEPIPVDVPDVLKIVPRREVIEVVLKCPCGCGDVVRVPATSNPLFRDAPHTLTLSNETCNANLNPIIDRRDICGAVFWISDGVALGGKP